MFESLGVWVVRRRRAVLVVAAGAVAVALLWGTQVVGHLTSGGFEDPASESARARTLAAERFGRLEADVVVLYRSDTTTVADVAFRRAVETHLAGVPRDRVAEVLTYWSTGAESLVSNDRRETVAVVRLDAHGEDTEAAFADVRDHLAAPAAGVSVSLGGHAGVVHDVNEQVERDIARAELLTLPVTLVLLVVIFGGLVAASLPLVIGVLAVLGALTLLRLLTVVTDVSVFSVNIVTMLGLGLSIDYALFIVSRFREEIRGGSDVGPALRTTMATAGRTVAFSGLTVAVSLASLLLFPQVFLRSMGLGGIAAVLVAMLAALTVLPALLAVIGRRVDRLRLPGGRRRDGRHRVAGAGAWHRVAHAVMRRPLLVVAALVPVLLLLGSPFLHARFGSEDYRVLPREAESHDVGDRLRHHFPGLDAEPLDVLVRTSGAVVSARLPELDAYARTLAALPGVEAADLGPADGDTARIVVRHAFDAQAEGAQDLVREIRATAPPAGTTVLVGGRTAELVDLLDSLARVVPRMLAVMAAVTLVLLFLAFGSVVLPIKAVLINALSLSASFGAVVWIFQDGNLSEALGVASTGSLDATQPLLMLALAFGLSMDYEVFLLSRIREQWDRGAGNAESVAAGLDHTGRIITSAALLLVVVIGGFSTSGIAFLKMIGIGMMIAIVVDATVVRLLLVPATMRLLGGANWWAPAPLAAFWRRYGFRETGTTPAAPDVGTPAPLPTPHPSPWAPPVGAAGRWAGDGA